MTFSYLGGNRKIVVQRQEDGKKRKEVFSAHIGERETGGERGSCFTHPFTRYTFSLHTVAWRDFEAWLSSTVCVFTYSLPLFFLSSKVTSPFLIFLSLFCFYPCTYVSQSLDLVDIYLVLGCPFKKKKIKLFFFFFISCLNIANASTPKTPSGFQGRTRNDQTQYANEI